MKAKYVPSHNYTIQASSRTKAHCTDNLKNKCHFLILFVFLHFETSKGKHQHNFTKQTTRAILNQYRRKGKIYEASKPIRHTQKASQVLTEQKIFRYTSNTKTNLPRRQTSQAKLDKHFAPQAIQSRQTANFPSC